MMAAAVRTNDSSKGSETLYMAFELGERQWKLGFTIGAGQKPWRRTITARDVGAVLHEIARAEQRFGLAPEAAGAVVTRQAATASGSIARCMPRESSTWWWTRRASKSTGASAGRSPTGWTSRGCCGAPSIGQGAVRCQ